MQEENLYHPNCIRTFTGAYINPFEPDINLIRIEDIAHSLSLQCRFAGHTKVFYSVAEHCIQCCEYAKPEHMIEALLHDASEAYLLDIPSPIKYFLPAYIAAEKYLMTLISEKFNFSFPLHEDVKIIDKAMLSREWENLVIKNSKYIIPQTSKEAEKQFLEIFHKYSR